ncbi:cation:proton antiporter domain-containing protein [Dissulfurispira sp.]|uniref:cation:proton antiporter domain-containing protein n=1 Tax=Dissulfurispira sp. TaxID=2817609 RepID=UPI002FDA13C5
MGLEFLKSLVLIFGVSAVVVFALGRLRIPSVVGFLVAGVILGPHGFQFIKDVHDVELLAEIGVILLMFTIGLEFSLKNLMTLRSQVLGGGLLQVALTTGSIALLSFFFFKQGLNVAVFDGFLVALSSTAIVVKLLMDRAEINAPHGRSSVGILIFQDLCVVPFMLLIPVLAGNGGGMEKIAFTMLKAFMVVGIVLFAARWAVPHILHEVVKTRSRELFVITIILLCIGTAFLTSKLGLSLALGAFLAGIVISESEYASQAISDILPFKESFTGLFFISVGMLMNIEFLGGNLASVIAVVFAILILKSVIGMVSAYIAGQPLRVSMQTGFYISQIGEFSFVLAVAGKAAGLLTEYAYQLFLSSSVMTMLFTPFIAGVSPYVSAWLVSRPMLKRLEQMKRGKEKESYPAKKSGHVIIIGFGINGSNLARVLKESGISYVVLEMNANTVKRMKKKGEPIYYGDGTSTEILHKMGIHRASVLVIAISDAAATRRIVQIARHENPTLHIIVRTRYVAEVDDLIKLGANEVIPEEFETSIEIFSRVLHHYHMPRNVIAEHIDNIRKNSYSALRIVELPKKHLAERYEFLKDIETETYLIKKGSHMSGHSIKELHLRAETGVTIIAVQRGDEVHQNPSPDFILKSDDVLLLIGKRKNINNAVEYLESERFLVARYHR